MTSWGIWFSTEAKFKFLCEENPFLFKLWEDRPNVGTKLNKTQNISVHAKLFQISAIHHWNKWLPLTYFVDKKNSHLLKQYKKRNMKGANEEGADFRQNKKKSANPLNFSLKMFSSFLLRKWVRTLYGFIHK